MEPLTSTVPLAVVSMLFPLIVVLIPASTLTCFEDWTFTLSAEATSTKGAFRESFAPAVRARLVVALIEAFAQVMLTVPLGSTVIWLAPAMMMTLLPVL